MNLRQFQDACFYNLIVALSPISRFKKSAKSGDCGHDNHGEFDYNNTCALGSGEGESGEPDKHRPTAKAALDRLKKGKPVDYKSEKAEKAAKNARPTTKDEQEYTKKNEFSWADRLKKRYKYAEAFPDNGPVDVQLTIRGRTRGIEMKTLVTGENDKITMSGTKKGKETESALDRKVKWQDENGSTVDTIVDDHRNRYNGGENKHLYSGEDDSEAIYYKRGTGSFRIGAMYRVKDQAELERLLEMPYHKLPKKAQGNRRGDHDDSYLERKK